MPNKADIPHWFVFSGSPAEGHRGLTLGDVGPVGRAEPQERGKHWARQLRGPLGGLHPSVPGLEFELHF